MAPGMPDRLYQQNHCGMYRSDDGGRQLARASRRACRRRFGFPAAVHPRDPATLYLLPLNGDIAGRYVPDAQGRGLAHARRRRQLAGAARRAAAGATCSSACCARPWRPTGSSPAGVYFGTNSGALYASADEGDSWRCIAQHLPLISSVETLVVEA